MSTDIDQFIEGGSPSAKFEAVGDQIEGEVVSLRMTQQTDIDGAPKTFKNGDPVMQLVVTIRTDDGDERSIYAKGGKYDVASGKGTSMLEAIKAALVTAGIKGSELQGHRLLVGHTGLGKKTNPAFSAPKLYSAKVTLAAPANDPFA